jgi:hypothetical protein
MKTMQRTSGARGAMGALLVGAAAVVTGCHPLGVASSPATSLPAGGSVSEARAQLGQLEVAARTSLTGYDRDAKFGDWASQGEGCNTRETVLQRDGEQVRVDEDCYPTSGSWTSPYDGETWTEPSDVDIDHMVPLAQGWVAGAQSWSQQQREQFANDLTRPQLFAVTDNVNQQKGDSPPDEWKPPLVAYWCTYATDWVSVKHHYALTITQAEKTALLLMLDTCTAGGRS